MTRRDALYNIERSRHIQYSVLAESLGAVVSSIMHPLRTVGDISRNFGMASKNLRTAVGIEIEFWEIARNSYLTELRSFLVPTRVLVTT